MYSTDKIDRMNEFFVRKYDILGITSSISVVVITFRLHRKGRGIVTLSGHEKCSSYQEIPGLNPRQDLMSCWPNGKAPDYG